MSLRDLITNLPVARVVGDADGTVAVGHVRADSREVQPGDVFVAVRGLRADGHAFVATAIARGAAAIVVESELPDVGVPQVVLAAPCTGAVALGILVGRSLGDPGQAMTLVGITGTNGKTTTTYLVESMLLAAGHRPGVIGTVSYRYAGRTEDAPYTTPTPHVLHETLLRMRAAGCTHVVMEVSSAALSMERLGGVAFAVAAFSNLTQDHLDVHGSMEAYAAAKRQLFAAHLAATGTAVVNVDDPAGLWMGAAAPGRVLRVTTTAPDVGPAEIAEISCARYDSTIRGITARVVTPRGPLDVEAPPLVGQYNVANIALAIGIGEALGLPHDAIARGIAT
ncbi:MAG: Mur ligase family protein, partial [Proteobacteria bacterium]|nr:Mur ligase family protein [Pseudomonadota bacterium]